MERLHAAGHDYVVTAYAARRLRLRGVSLGEVRSVLGDPASITPSTHDPHRLVFRRTARGRRLTVVIEGTSGTEPRDIVTAWGGGQDE